MKADWGKCLLLEGVIIIIIIINCLRLFQQNKITYKVQIHYILLTNRRENVIRSKVDLFSNVSSGSQLPIFKLLLTGKNMGDNKKLKLKTKLYTYLKIALIRSLLPIMKFSKTLCAKLFISETLFIDSTFSMKFS